jgi:hypothetical protein
LHCGGEFTKNELRFLKIQVAKILCEVGSNFREVVENSSRGGNNFRGVAENSRKVASNFCEVAAELKRLFLLKIYIFRLKKPFLIGF